MAMARRVRRAVRLVAVGLVVTALAQEAMKPRAERTWRGRVLGVVPYDFNPPTWQRFRDAYWNPNDPRLFTDRVFGVGWAVNLHSARELLSRMVERSFSPQEQPIRLRRFK